MAGSAWVRRPSLVRPTYPDYISMKGIVHPMCLAIPTRIRTVKGQLAEVEIGGVERTISLALAPEAQVGDYVIVHTGFAISVLDQEEAEESLRLFAEMAEMEDAELQ
jgi:hydrogenase expression/formation protein HypC